MGINGFAYFPPRVLRKQWVERGIRRVEDKTMPNKPLHNPGKPIQDGEGNWYSSRNAMYVLLIYKTPLMSPSFELTKRMGK